MTALKTYQSKLLDLKQVSPKLYRATLEGANGAVYKIKLFAGKNGFPSPAALGKVCSFAIGKDATGEWFGYFEKISDTSSASQLSTAAAATGLSDACRRRFQAAVIATHSGLEWRSITEFLWHCHRIYIWLTEGLIEEDEARTSQTEETIEVEDLPSDNINKDDIPI